MEMYLPKGWEKCLTFTDAIVLYLNTIEELGTIEEIFKKKNIKIYSYKPKPMLEKNKMPKSFNNFPFITQQVIPLNL